jgi:hypothetical protein
VKRHRAGGLTDEVAQRHAVVGVEVDAAHPLPREVERAGPEEQLPVARGIGAIGGTEVLAPS